MERQKNNLEKDIKELKLLTFNSITSLVELNKKLEAFDKTYTRDDYIKILYDRGLNANQISKELGASYSVVYHRIKDLKAKGIIKERGRVQ